MKKLLLILFIFLTNYQLIAQINMGNLGTVTNGCGQTFYDSGGSGGNYGSSQNYTATFCAPAGQYITFIFTQFALGSGDNLRIYNGPTTASPLLGNYPATSPGQVSSTLGGCLTFVFTSNAPDLGIFPTNGAGWTATISCATTIPPPPPPPPGSCAGAQPFCTSTGVTFPASVGTTSESGPNYGCLSTQPSPGWYYLNIATSGNILINLSNSAAHDIDFAIWGPFATQAAMCAGTTATPLDCSYDPAATETVDIPNAVVGQWYILVITNFANTPTNITAAAGNASGTDGTTNCAILCNLTALTAVPGPCVSPANTYSATGQITVLYPPTSGTLTVTSSCGGSVNVPTPWTSPISYTLPGIPANGAACSITATFSADPTCTLTTPYTAPASCTSSCLMNLFTTDIGFCQPNNTFPVSGTFSYTNSPATGTVTVVVTNSSGTYTQTFNPLFVNGTVYNYNITNCISDGSAATVQVYFTATPACQQTINFTSPASCGCAAQIGTYTADIIGISNNNYVLCYGDVIDIQTNNDWVDPAIATNPPGPTYDPGVSWLIYSCPPTIGLVPTATQDVADDPCLLGIVSDFDLNDLNDQGMLNAFAPGTFTNNTIYYVPITMYSIVGGYYSYVNTTVPCYDLGTPYAVQYLPQITSPFVQNCTAVTATITGGLPAVNGSSFTTVPGSLTPANASFGNTTCANGGTIVINGLTAGQVFTFQVQDANGCPKTVTGTFTGPPTLSYPSATYCKNGANPSPTVVGVAGGTYTSTAGLVFVSSATGVINLTTSTAGTYTITYTTPAVPGPVCTATFVITINPLPTVIVNSPTICSNATATVTATPGTVGPIYSYAWTVPGGVTNPGNTASFTTTVAGNYSVIITNTSTLCTGTASGTVTVNPLPIVTANSPTVCAGASVTLSGGGANTYSWDNGVTNGTAFVPAASGPYTVTGTSLAGCINTAISTVTVNPIPVVGTTNESICTGGTVALTASGATTYTWSPATYLSATTGSSVNFVNGTTTTYTVTGTSLGCTSSSPLTVTVTPSAPINAGVNLTTCVGTPITITATGGVTYLWSPATFISATTGASVTFTPGTTTTYTVNGTDAAGCTGTDEMTVTVNPLPTAIIAGTVTVCQGAPAQTITFTGAGATAPYTFTYTLNGGANQTVTSVGNTATVSVPTGTAATYTYALVSVASANTCS
ncbi:MAG: hypothetical protein RI883_1268, partial [Bacteroidota bacterium]